MNVAGITQKNIGYVARIIDEAVRAYPSNPINQGDLKKKEKDQIGSAAILFFYKTVSLLADEMSDYLTL